MLSLKKFCNISDSLLGSQLLALKCRSQCRIFLSVIKDHNLFTALLHIDRKVELPGAKLYTYLTLATYMTKFTRDFSSFDIMLLHYE